MVFSQLDALFPTIMEARNFVSAREILSSGDWIHTTLNGLPRYEKPPLPTWITAVFGYIFGTHNLWALRLPNAFLLLINLRFVYLLAKKLFEYSEVALYASYSFITMYLVLYVGKSNVWDVYCHCFMWIAIYYFIKSVENNKWKSWLTFAILVSASLMSKGPMGVLVLFIPFFVGYLIGMNPKVFKEINYFKVIVSLVLIIILGFSWYAYLYETDKEVFMRILDKEVEARATRHVRPWYRYLSFPIQTGLWVIPAFLSLFLWSVRKRIYFPKTFWTTLVWVLGGVLILSIFPEKKERYLFPILFPLSLLTGYCIYIWNHKSLDIPWIKMGRNIFYFLVTLSVIVLLIVVPLYLKSFSFKIFLFCFFSFSIALSLMGAMTRNRWDRTFKYSVYFLVLINTLLISIMLPKIFDNPQKIYVSEVKSQYPNLPLYSVDTYSPEIWYNYQKIIPNFTPEKINKGAIEDSVFLLLKTEEIQDSLLLRNYTVQKTYPFDENWEPKGNKNYSERKVGNIYLVKRNN